MTRPKDDWLQDVGSRYKPVSDLSKEEARTKFLQVGRSFMRRLQHCIGGCLWLNGSHLHSTITCGTFCHGWQFPGKHQLKHTWSYPLHLVCSCPSQTLRGLPYGLSTFFAVKKVEDPVGLLPPKVILAVNFRGVHFFRPRWAVGCSRRVKRATKAASHSPHRCCRGAQRRRHPAGCFCPFALLTTH